MTQLGNEIKAARERLGLEQSELARRAGVSQSTISNIEAGKSKEPKAKNLEALAKILELDSTYLKRLAGLLSDEEKAKLEEKTPSTEDEKKQLRIRQFLELFNRQTEADQRAILEALAMLPQLSDASQQTVVALIKTLKQQESDRK